MSTELHVYGVLFSVNNDTSTLNVGEYFQRVAGINWIHAVDRLLQTFGEEMTDIIIEVVSIDAFGVTAKVCYDRDVIEERIALDH